MENKIKIQAKIFDGKDKVLKGNFIIDNDLFNDRVHKIFNINTFVFFPEDIYNSLQDSVKEEISKDVIPADQELTPEEMIKKDVMIFLIDDDSIKEELLYLINKFIGSDVYYCEVIE